MQVRHLFLLTRESGTTIGSRNSYYTPGEWKDRESPSCKTGGKFPFQSQDRRAAIDSIGLASFPSYVAILFPPPLCSTTIAANLLLVDEIMKAGMSSLKG